MKPETETETFVYVSPDAARLLRERHLVVDAAPAPLTAKQKLERFIATKPKTFEDARQANEADRTQLRLMNQMLREFYGQS